MDTTSDAPRSGRSDAAEVPQQRLDEVVAVVRLELVNAGVGSDARTRGFNPYDGRLGRANRDLWGSRRRA
jgi:hypothetical protein